MRLRVECYAGYRAEESPRRIFFGEHKVEVAAILDRWLAPDHRYFKLRGDDGAVYIIRHDVNSGEWELTMYDRGGEGFGGSNSGSASGGCNDGGEGGEGFDAGRG